MDKIKTSELLKNLIDNTEDALLKEELKAIIKDINSTSDESGIAIKDKPIDVNDKKIASKVSDVVYSFFSRVCASVVAKEIVDYIHKL